MLSAEEEILPLIDKTVMFISKMEDLDLISKLSCFKGDSKFKFKIKLFLLNPKLYYKMWKKFKNTI